MRKQGLSLLELGDGRLDLPTVQAESSFHLVNQELGGAAWERLDPPAELGEQ